MAYVIPPFVFRGPNEGLSDFPKKVSGVV